MTTALIIIVAVLALAVIANIFITLAARRQKGEIIPQDDSGLKLILQQVNELSRTVDGKLGETNKMVNDSVRNQFSESARLIQDINERVTKQLVDVAQKLTESKEVSKQVLGIADQLQSLQDVLKNPKQRGVLGEYYLEALLKNVLPPGSFEMQYKFSDGEIVDAAVFVKNKVIPIDSKFSLENYNRMVEERNDAEKERLGKLFENDLKLRIKETSKYIRPNENTMDFAFMFIPHEAIYYDLLTNKITSVTDESENLIQRAASKYRVIIVSPTSFLAYLQTVLQGLKALQIEETAKDIIKRVEDLNKHLKTFEQYHGKLGNALSVAVSHFNASNKEYKKIDKDVLRITGAGIGIEQVILEKPETELVE